MTNREKFSMLNDLGGYYKITTDFHKSIYRDLCAVELIKSKKVNVSSLSVLSLEMYNKLNKDNQLNEKQYWFLRKYVGK